MWLAWFDTPLGVVRRRLFLSLMHKASRTRIQLNKKALMGANLYRVSSVIPAFAGTGADVDTNGLPHAIDITTADITDRKGALQAFDRYKNNLPDVENVLADGGYTG
jgi:hypothetical protein